MAVTLQFEARPRLLNIDVRDNEFVTTQELPLSARTTQVTSIRRELFTAPLGISPKW
jgi:hypothetical protein